MKQPNPIQPKEHKPKGEFNNVPNELGYILHNGVRHDVNDSCPWCPEEQPIQECIHQFLGTNKNCIFCGTEWKEKCKTENCAMEDCTPQQSGQASHYASSVPPCIVHQCINCSALGKYISQQLGEDWEKELRRGGVWLDMENIETIVGFVKQTLAVDRASLLAKVEREIIGEDEGYVLLTEYGRIVRSKRDIQDDKARNILRAEQREMLKQLREDI